MWVGVGGILLIVGLAGTTHYYKNDRDTIQASFDGYKATVKALGEKAQAEKEAVIAKSTLENDRVQTALDATLAANKRLQLDAAKARSSRGYLPPVPTGSTNTSSGTCFDRAKLESALSVFGNGVATLVAEGDAAIIRRDGWHKWFDAQAKVNPSVPAK
jgi:hypothetical protein